MDDEIAGLQTLEEIVHWGLARDRLILEVVVMDEYTHDVVIAGDDGQLLVFDTT